MKWIGLTGGIGSGKSTVAEILRQKGYAVIDADEMAKLAVSPGTTAFQQIIKAFGPEILNSDKSLDRKALASRVFGNAQELERLEQIIHPEVQKLTLAKREALAKSGTAIAFYDVPLLYEKNLHDRFDAVVVVVSTEQQQIERVMQRNAWTREEVVRRISMQLALADKAKRANFIIQNDKGLEDLKRQIDDFLTQLTSPKNSRA